MSSSIIIIIIIIRLSPASEGCSGARRITW